MQDQNSATEGNSKDSHTDTECTECTEFTQSVSENSGDNVSEHNEGSTKGTQGTLKVLMIQRKDTMGYTDFIRGKYNSMETIKLLLEEMTSEEHDNLKKYTFNQIWDLLWINHNSRTYRNEYEYAKNKFQLLDVPTLLSLYPSKYTYQEFGLPKGRRNIHEHDIQCAEREFYEETGYSSANYEPLDENKYIVEEFTGTDNIKYKHIYFLSKLKPGCITNPRITNSLQMEEVKNIGWFTIPEALSLIRPYDTAKKHVLGTFQELL